MSAFIVSDINIDVIVNAAAKEFEESPHGQMRLGWENNASIYMTKDELGRELLKENYRSVEYRYGDEKSTEWENYKFKIPSRVYKQKDIHGRETELRTLDPILVIKTINCLEYQSCEHNEWNKSKSKLILENIKSRLVSKIPGYDEAPWGL